MGLTKQRSTLKRILRQNYGLSYGSVADDRIHRALENGLRRLRDRDWNCLQGTAPLTTKAPYATGTVTIVDPAADGILAFSNTLPTDVGGQFIEIAGNRGWYEIKERTGATGASLIRGYIGPAADSTPLAFRIMYPLVNLPANFRRLGDLWEVEPQTSWRLRQVEQRHGWYLQAWFGSGTQPRTYAIVQGRNDPNTMRLLFYPAPDAVRGYDLFYVRDPGWFAGPDPLTATWELEATADTDYLDWPDRHMDLFYKAALVSLYEEDDPSNKLAFALSSFNELLDQCKADDSRWPGIGKMGGRGTLRGIDVEISGAMPMGG